MERLFERIEAKGMARYIKGNEKYVPIPHRAGVVARATADETGLTLVLDGVSKPFFVPGAQFRVDVGEEVVAYSCALRGISPEIAFSEMQVQGLQVLDESSQVKFQYVAKSFGSPKVFLEESDARLA